jgi:hypothetical protein
VVTEEEGTHHVATFVARESYRAQPVSLHVDRADVRTAEVVSPSGTVPATATLG